MQKVTTPQHFNSLSDRLREYDILSWSPTISSRVTSIEQTCTDLTFERVVFLPSDGALQIFFSQMQPIVVCIVAISFPQIQLQFGRKDLSSCLHVVCITTRHVFPLNLLTRKYTARPLPLPINQKHSAERSTMPDTVPHDSFTRISTTVEVRVQKWLSSEVTATRK